jgi:hypothetical protein
VFANGTLVRGNLVQRLSRPRWSQRFAFVIATRHFDEKYCGTISTDTHIDQLVILPLKDFEQHTRNAPGMVRLKYFDKILSGGDG